MQSEIIKVENLIFDYIKEDTSDGSEAVKVTKTRALRNISLKVKKGEFVSIIGGNGSGKSTLGKNFNALLKPTEGIVYVKGWDTKIEEYLWQVRESVGMVFQNPDNQLVSAIVEEDVAFGPENMGLDSKEIRDRVDKALRDVGMYEYKDKAPHLLSGGQKQRIAIAGSIAMKPEIIIFDEPTAMLDPKGRKEILRIMKELNADGVTVILITHFMEEAENADRVIVMNGGEIVSQGTPRDLFREREMIRGNDLDVPLAVEVAYRLRKKGIDIPKDIIYTEELIEYLCQLK